VSAIITYQDFFEEFLNQLHITPAHPKAALRAMATVSVIEGANHRYNPFNVKTKVPGSTDFNKQGVQAYPNAMAGVTASVITFGAPRWQWVRAALRQIDNRYLALHEYAEQYATWDSYPDFFAISQERADARLLLRL
jgi:hypothetical protein